MTLTHIHASSYVHPPVCFISETGHNISMKFYVPAMQSLMLYRYEY